MEDFKPLMNEAWLRASESLDGTATCYLADVERLWAIAKAAGLPGTSTQIACALVVSSILALSTNLERGLQLECAETQAVKTRVLIAWARQLDNPSDRALALMGLAHFLGEREADEVRNEVLRDSERIGMRWRVVLSEPNLFSSLDNEWAIQQGLLFARGIQDPRERANALISFATVVRGEDRQCLVDEVLCTAFYHARDDLAPARALDGLLSALGPIPNMNLSAQAWRAWMTASRRLGLPNEKKGFPEATLGIPEDVALFLLDRVRDITDKKVKDWVGR